MIIVGDIACPTEALSKQLKIVLDSNAEIFKDQSIVLNLEGLFGEESLLQATVPVLYNHFTILKSFATFSSVTACLANNHILDLPEEFNATIKLLEKEQVKFVGAGKSFEEAYAPVKFKDGNHEVIVFNECWDFLLYHQKNPGNSIHIATIQFHQLEERVRKCKSENPQSCIIIYLHWSLDLETLPYPMYRQFSKALIDAGGTVVAGSHAHCVQGGEQYKDGYIVYGLGNFFLPNHVFASGKLFYPALASTQLVFEYRPETKEAFCHWFKYEEIERQHHFQHIISNPFQTSLLLKKYTPYQQMDHIAYIHFFKKNRRKKVMIPLFKTYHNKQKLYTLTSLLKARATFARMMARVNLIKWGS